MRGLIACILLPFLGFPTSAAPPERGVFEVAGAPPSHALMTVADDLPAGPWPTVSTSSPMLLNLGGYVGVLTAAQVGQLGNCVRTGGKAPELNGTFRRVCTVHLIDRAGVDAKRVEILTGSDGVTAARERAEGGAAAGRTVLLDPAKYLPLSIGWPRYRGPYSSGSPGLADPAAAQVTIAEGTVVEMARPLAPSPLYLDEKTFGDRFISGGRSNALRIARKLEDEKFFVRVPAGLDAKKPACLLIYINAMQGGEPPQVLFKGLDQLGIACVGIENAGNDRPVVDRFQLVIDALFAASERIHIDPRRVYLSGISGGGRCCMRLQCCFPDYFTGAVPIVGTSAYFDTPLGNGKRSPAGFDRPSAARFTLLRSRRIGVITGPADFNYGEIVAMTKRLTDDRLQVRVFEHEMGHQLPTADWFAEAIGWVDGPYQETAAKEAADAQQVLDGYIKRWGDVPPPAGDTRAREELVKVTRVGPWTAAAWRAVELLK